jgi:LAO/AO transport system kinase
MLRFRGHIEWIPPVVPTVGTTGEGIADLVEQVRNHAEFLSTSGLGERRHYRRVQQEIHRLARRELSRDLESLLQSESGTQLIDSVLERQIAPGRAAMQAIALLRAGSGTEDTG